MKINWKAAGSATFFVGMIMLFFVALILDSRILFLIFFGVIGAGALAAFWKGLYNYFAS